MPGGHCLRGQSTRQSTAVPPSGESEHHAIVKAAAQRLHTAAVAAPTSRDSEGREDMCRSSGLGGDCSGGPICV
eukprot:3692976-Amphidinium_carterae.1